MTLPWIVAYITFIIIRCASYPEWLRDGPYDATATGPPQWRMLVLTPALLLPDRRPMGQIRWTEANASPHIRFQLPLTPRFFPPVPRPHSRLDRRIEFPGRLRFVSPSGFRAPARSSRRPRGDEPSKRWAGFTGPCRENRRCPKELTLGLKCRLCGKLYPKEALNFCTEDFGPLEVVYDYDAIGRILDKQTIRSRPRTMWRYRELLPIDGEPTVGLHVGGTPLIKADRLAKVLGVAELYIKNDAVNHPTPLVQGPSCRRRPLEGGRARLSDRGLCLDRQPRRERRGERGGGGT